MENLVKQTPGYSKTINDRYSAKIIILLQMCYSTVATHTHNRFTALLESVRDYPGEQVPER